MKRPIRATAVTVLLALVGSMLAAVAAPTVALAAASLSVSDVQVDEGTATGSTRTDLTFVVTLTGAGADPSGVTFDWYTADGTAKVADGDYDPGSGSGAGFSGEPNGDGDYTTTITVGIVQDGVAEFDETLTLNLDDVTGATITDGVGVGTIVNDDGAEVSIEGPSAAVKEGPPGDTRTATLTISADWNGIAGTNRKSVFVDWVTGEDGDTADPGADYEADSGTVELIPPASGNLTTAEIAVTILGDDIHEGTPNETLRVAVDAARRGQLATATWDTVAIEDDDDVPTITVDGADVVEGNSGTSATTLPVRLSHPSAFETVIDYATADGTATNAGGDYVPVPSGTKLTIEALQTAAAIEVEAKGDTADEPNEDFEVNLSLPTGTKAQFPDEVASIAGVVTIRDDDGPYVSFARASGQPTSTPRLEHGDLDLPEGQAGQTTPYTFRVLLSDDLDEAVTVTYSTVDGTATAVQNDYQTTSGSVTIPAGTTTADITVPVLGDDFAGLSEWFFLDLTSVEPTSAASLLDDRARGTLLNDDGPVIHVSNASVVEGDPGDSGTTEVALELTIDPAYTDETPGCDTLDCRVTVDYRTADGTATAGQDYQAADGTVTIPEGQTRATLTLEVERDLTPEPTETFAVGFANPQFATLGSGGATARTVRVTIVNDDGPKVTVASDVTVTEGHDGTRDATFAVRLAEASTDAVEVDFATADGTAKVSDNDYIARSGTVKILPGQLTATVTVKVIGDRRFEGTETFSLKLRDPAFAVLGSKKAGTATITNDDTNTAPVADAGPDLTGTAGKAVAFDGSASSDANGDALSHAWSFGDGSSGTGATPSHAYADAGTYTATLTVTDPHGAKDTDQVVVEVSPSSTGFSGGDGGFDPGVETVGRSSGTTRIQTALDVSADHWASADDVVLATAFNFPDALAGGTLAARLDAPLLLTGAGELPTEVSAELARLGAKRVWILGGDSVVSQGIEDALGADGYDVRRIEGKDRFATAAAVAAEVGASPDNEVALALGIHAIESRAWPDALSAGSLAAGPDRLPILLTRAAEVPAATEQALAALGTRRVLLVGGTAAIGQAVADRLSQLGYEVRRLDGPDRYATSVAVAADALTRTTAGDVPVVFATGGNYPDGLAAAALAARLDGIVVLVNGKADQLHTDVDGFLRDGRDRLTAGVVVGGTAVVSEAIRAQLATAMGD